MVLLGDFDDHQPWRHRASHHSRTCLARFTYASKTALGIFNLIYSFIGLGQLSLLLQLPGAASSWISAFRTLVDLLTKHSSVLGRLEMRFLEAWSVATGSGQWFFAKSGPNSIGERDEEAAQGAKVRQEEPLCLENQ